MAGRTMFRNKLLYGLKYRPHYQSEEYGTRWQEGRNGRTKIANGKAIAGGSTRFGLPI